jgi:hypothetical protein
LKTSRRWWTMTSSWSMLARRWVSRRQSLSHQGHSTTSHALASCHRKEHLFTLKDRVSTTSRINTCTQPTEPAATQAQHASQAAQRPNFPQNRQNTPTGTPVRNNTPAPTGGNTYFKCGEAGHYANRCPKRNAQNAPGQFNNSGQMQTP